MNVSLCIVLTMSSSTAQGERITTWFATMHEVGAARTFGALVSRNVLSFKTLVQHVDHFGAHVDDQHGHRH